MTEDRLRVIVSAFACGPDWGSEVGMGWGWVTALSRQCDLTVVTEAGFQSSIEKYYRSHPDSKSPDFRYIDIGALGRKLFWSQNNWGFYGAYRIWQRKAYQLCRALAAEGNHHLLHQLNVTGYREPGLLWRLELPLVWGPIGGHMQMPWRFMPTLGLAGAIYHGARNTINALQMRMSPRVRCAMRRAACLVAAAEADRKAIRGIHHRSAHVIGEAGAIERAGAVRPHGQFDGSRPLKLVWVGAFKAGKALPLGLRALRAASDHVNAELHILGGGPCETAWKKLASRLGIAAMCAWYGRLDHDRALAEMRSCDAMLVCSLMEGTSNALMEALSLGVPVICHDAHGSAAAVDESCGIKVPLRSPSVSVAGFADAVIRMGRDPALVQALSQGALARAQALSWDRKAEEMVRLYREALSVKGSRDVI